MYTNIKNLTVLCIVSFLLSMHVARLLCNVEVCDCEKTIGTASCCYVGALEIPLKSTEAQQLFLYYNGALVRVNGGIYCFKEDRDLKKLNILFVSPALISYVNDENTICHLTLADDAQYDFYQLKRMVSLWECSKTSAGWHIKHKPMQKKTIAGHVRIVVPEHTLIIPLISSFFEKDKDDVAFIAQAAADTQAVVRLPSPKVAKNFDTQQLKDALIQAHMSMMNLKCVHAEPEQQGVCMDGHTVKMTV